MIRLNWCLFVLFKGRHLVDIIVIIVVVVGGYW